GIKRESAGEAESLALADAELISGRAQAVGNLSPERGLDERRLDTCFELSARCARDVTEPEQSVGEDRTREDDRGLADQYGARPKRGEITITREHVDAERVHPASSGKLGRQQANQRAQHGRLPCAGRAPQTQTGPGLDRERQRTKQASLAVVH